jgi:hypothetical protein
MGIEAKPTVASHLSSRKSHVRSGRKAKLPTAEPPLSEALAEAAEKWLAGLETRLEELEARVRCLEDLAGTDETPREPEPRVQ